VPEVVDQGVTGWIVDSIPAAIEAVDRARSCDRAAVRARFEQRFSAERMAKDYLRLYQKLAGGDIDRAAA
jgi:glycosyltransferase involved in cell wall biosynthesis